MATRHRTDRGGDIIVNIDMKQILMNNQTEGRRLDQLLSRMLALAPSGFIHRMLRKKNITLNDRKADGSERLVAGDLVKIYLSDETFLKFSKPQEEEQRELAEKTEGYLTAYRHVQGDAGDPVGIVYEDEALLVLNKPVGVLSQKATELDLSLNEWALGYLLQTDALTAGSLLGFKPSVANRLDRNTSGLVIVVKTLVAAREVALLQQSGRLIKTYHAVVCGRVAEADSILSTSEKQVERRGTRQIIRTKVKKCSPEANGAGGEKVALSYKPIAVNETENLSLVAVRLYEGKIHQIRAQMAHIGYPLLGDYKYGDRVRNDEYKARFGLQSQLLHARSLIFPDMKESFRSLARMSGLSLMATYPGLFAEIATEIFKR